MEQDDDELASRIMEAVREGDVDAVNAFLDAGGKVNLCSPSTGRTLLHVACRQGYAEVVSLLLAKGANVGATTLRHLTPLHLASHEGHFKVSRLLLEAWAPVDDRDKAGTSPLHLASQKGHMDVVRLLLQCGADKDGVDESGWAPLHFSAWKGHLGVARMLLQAGANAKACDLQQKSTALHIACAWGHPEVAKVLLEFGADSSAVDSNNTLPDHAIGAGCPDEVDPETARELSKMILEHRTKRNGKYASSSLECVVDSLRAKVCELEDQLARAGRDRLELVAYSQDENHRTFSAALKPECTICQVEVKEAVLDPCRHLAVCCGCAESLPSCPFCACPVRGYEQLESTEAFARMAALEDEGSGLRAQLERFSRRIRDLVTTNGELRLDVRRAKADGLILSEERRALEERFLSQPVSPSSIPSRAVSTADSDCGSFSPPALTRRHAERLKQNSDVDNNVSSGGGGARSRGAKASTGEWNIRSEERSHFTRSRNGRGFGEMSINGRGSSAPQSLAADRTNGNDPVANTGELRVNAGDGSATGARDDRVHNRQKSWASRTAGTARPNTLVSRAIKGSSADGNAYKSFSRGTTSTSWGTPTLSYQHGGGTPADTNRGFGSGWGSSRDNSRDKVVNIGHVRTSTQNSSERSVGGDAYKPYPGDAGPSTGGTPSVFDQHGNATRGATAKSGGGSSAPPRRVNSREQPTKLVRDSSTKIVTSDDAPVRRRTFFASRNSRGAATTLSTSRSDLQVPRATRGSRGSPEQAKPAVWDGNDVHDVFENAEGDTPTGIHSVANGGKSSAGVGVVEAEVRTNTQPEKFGRKCSSTSNDYIAATDENAFPARVCNDNRKTVYCSFSEDDGDEYFPGQGPSPTGVVPTVLKRLGGGVSAETNTGGGESTVGATTRPAGGKISVSDEGIKLGDFLCSPINVKRNGGAAGDGSVLLARARSNLAVAETAHGDSSRSGATHGSILGQTKALEDSKASAFNQGTIGASAEQHNTSSDSFGAGNAAVFFSRNTRSVAPTTKDPGPSLPLSSRASSSTSGIGNTSADILPSRHSGCGATGDRGGSAGVEAAEDSGDVPRQQTIIRGRQRVRRRRATGETEISAARTPSATSTDRGSVFSYGTSVSSPSRSPVVLQRLSSDTELIARAVAVDE